MNLAGMFASIAKALGYKEPWLPYPPVSGIERPSPQGWVNQENIVVLMDRVTINEPDLLFFVLSGTNSMDGWMDEHHSVLVKKLSNHLDLVEGDIIIFSSPIGKIVHKIEKIDSDVHGRIYTTQGINNDRPDPYIIRKENIVGVVVAWVATKKSTGGNP